MTDEDKAARRARNLRMLGKTEEQVDDHNSREMLKTEGVELYNQMMMVGATPPPIVSPEEEDELIKLMNRIIEIAGCGSVALVSPEHQAIMNKFAGARNEVKEDWLGRAIMLMLSIEVASHVKGPGGAVIVKAKPETGDFVISIAAPEYPAPPNDDKPDETVH